MGVKISRVLIGLFLLVVSYTPLSGFLITSPPTWFYIVWLIIGLGNIILMFYLFEKSLNKQSEDLSGEILTNPVQAPLVPKQSFGEYYHPKDYDIQPTKSWEEKI